MTSRSHGPTTSAEAHGEPSAAYVLTPVSPHDDAEDSSPSIDFKRFLEAIRRRAWIVVLVTAVSVGAAALYTGRLPRLYQSTTTVVVDTSTAKVLTGVAEVVQMGSGSGWADPGFYEKEYRIMRSRAVARRAGEMIDVIHDDEWTGLNEVTDPEKRERLRRDLDPADFIMGTYSVKPETSPNVVRITAVGPNRERVALIANAVAEAYVARNLDRRVEGTQEASTWLAAQNIELRTRLEGSEDALYAFMEENNVLNASLTSQLTEVTQRLASFNTELAAVEASAIRKKLDKSALSQARLDSSLIDSLPEIRNAPVINALKTKLIDLRAQKTELESRYLAAHPKVKSIYEQIGVVRKDLEHEISSIMTSLDRNQASVTSTVGGLQQAIAAERIREARLNKLALSYNRLKREVDTNEKLYDIVTTRMKEADLTGALRINNISILDRARVPQAPFRPVPSLNITLGFFVGLLLGLAIPITIELVDNTVKTQEDLQQAVQAPFLGILPAIEAKRSRSEDTSQRDLHVLTNPKSSSAESARFIRTNLLFMSPDKPLQTMMVTSAAPQEGKTTTAISLAATMATSGSRTLIIDTDMRRPRLHRAFKTSNEVGLSSLIVNEGGLKDAIQATEHPDLDFLPCGPIPPNPAELLHTARFTELVNELKTIYDRIIFDSAPVGAVADPVVLGTQVDGVVVVAKSQKTSRVALKQIARALRDANANILGVVLNDVDMANRRYGSYYYQYYRQYGSYYGERDEASTPGRA